MTCMELTECSFHECHIKLRIHTKWFKSRLGLRYGQFQPKCYIRRMSPEPQSQLKPHYCISTNVQKTHIVCGLCLRIHVIYNKWLLMFYVEGEVMYTYVDIDVFSNDVYITQLLLSYRNVR